MKGMSKVIHCNVVTSCFAEALEYNRNLTKHSIATLQLVKLVVSTDNKNYITNYNNITKFAKMKK